LQVGCDFRVVGTVQFQVDSKALLDCRDAFISSAQAGERLAQIYVGCRKMLSISLVALERFGR
jgi:hypothetical protein